MVLVAHDEPHDQLEGARRLVFKHSTSGINVAVTRSGDGAGGLAAASCSEADHAVPRHGVAGVCPTPPAPQRRLQANCLLHLESQT